MRLEKKQLEEELLTVYRTNANKKHGTNLVCITKICELCRNKKQVKQVNLCQIYRLRCNNCT